nr:SpoIIE family protein phosphatase [Streptomyces acidipaludis]
MTDDTRDQESPDQGVGRLAATVARLQEQVRQAHLAAEGQALLQMATGVLVERLKCGPAAAARHLAELAASTGMPALELAVDIINQAAQDELTQVARDFLDGLAGADAPAGSQAGGSAAASSAAVRLRTAETGTLLKDNCRIVAQSILEHALSPLGANAVAIWATGPGASLQLVGHAGIPDVEAEQWYHVPPGVLTPARQALTSRRSVWLPVLSESAVPSVGHRTMPDGGRVAVPAEASGRVLGVLEICWPNRLEPQPPQIHRQIEALAEIVAHTLSSGSGPGADSEPARSDAELIDLINGVHEPILLLVPHLDGTGRLLDFRIAHTNPHFVDPAGRPRSAVNGALLLEAYPVMAGEHGLLDIIERVYATGEPFRDTAMPLNAAVGQVHVPTIADVSVTRHHGSILLVWRIEDEAARLANLLQHAQRLGRIGGFEEDLVTGRVTWNSQLHDLYGLPPTAVPVSLERLAAHTHPDDAPAIGRFLRTLLHHRKPASAAFRLQRPDGIVRHVRVVAEPVLDAAQRLVSVRGAYQDISTQHWTEVALTATRDQLAQSEQQTAERNRIARQLQHAIMPPAHAPLSARGLAVAVRYRPAEDEHLVGGDWYDAVMLPSRQILLSVGDVAGHGIDAATGMVALRNALRGLAATGAGPGQILTWLNIVAHHLTEDVTATAVCGLFDPDTRELTWARAGHLPPLLVRDGRAEHLPLTKGILLGATGEAAYEEQRFRLDPGDTLLMYTDGLIERRDRSLPDTLEQLLDASMHPSASLDEHLDHLLTHSSSDTDDDTCIIGVRLAAASTPGDAATIVTG